MLIHNEYVLDTLSTEEIAFLKKRAKKDGSIFHKMLFIMVACSLFFSYFGGWKPIERTDTTEAYSIFVWEYYFITLGILLVVFGVILRFWRTMAVGNIYKDLRQKTKIIEHVTIQKKTYIPHNSSYHFYLDSIQKLSIEVSHSDFDSLQEGDEINIEYSKNAGVYFGYF